MSSGLRLGGLSSGLDTEAIVSQLMAIERQPRSRIELKQAAAQARRDALTDINTKLKALKTAASNLTAASSWAPTQTVTSSDAAKVGGRAIGAITPGTYDVQVTQLARAAERTYTTRTSIQTRNITITSTATGATIDVAIPPGSSVDEIVSYINSNPDVPVVARNFNGQLLLQAKAMGTANAFTASSFLLTSQVSSVSARDSQFSVNGVNFTRSSNTVTDVEPGLEFTLGGVTTSSVQIEVGSATVDGKALASKMKAFVDAYNAVVDATRSRISEKKVLNPTTTADAKKGVLFGDSTLTQLTSQLRNGVMDPVAVGNSTSIDELAEIGISTGAPTGGVSTPESIAGKLTFDETKFLQAFQNDPSSVERLLRGTTVEQGFATRLDNVVQPFISVGGVMEGRLTASSSELTRLGNDLKRMDDRLSRKETYLRRQFTALETALARLNSQSVEMSSKLAGMSSNDDS